MMKTLRIILGFIFFVQIQVQAQPQPTTAIVETEYSGEQMINTLKFTGGHVLIDIIRGIHTLDSERFVYQTKTVNNPNWEEVVKDNTPNGFNLKTKAALDAHWGAAMTYDYFKNVHGRNSYDHQGGEFLVTIDNESRLAGNAQWIQKSDPLNGSGYPSINIGPPTTYNGTGGFLRQSSLDIVAHEFGHGVTEYSSGLSTKGESGAIDEGLSDIWAVCVKNYVKNKGLKEISEDDLWSYGEDIDKRQNKSGVRHLNDPDYSDQPDTYLGTNWIEQGNCTPSKDNDHCGTHTNMSILTYWFYLLSEGGSGTNDNGTDYNVSGIGIEKAEKIVYKASTEYFTETTDIHSGAGHMLKAAGDLYGGGCSEEAMAVREAWKAVGIVDLYDQMMLDCNGVCVKESNLGDGTCDSGPLYYGAPSIDLRCYENDKGDCQDDDSCPNGEIRDCNGNCAPESWLGDSSCDDGAYANGQHRIYNNGNYSMETIYIYFNCDAFDNDGGDCQDDSSCPDGEVLDCDETGDCILESWIGDGYPDCWNQAYGADLSCYDNDGGDCQDDSSCSDGEVLDCDGTGDCILESWIGDGYPDCWDQAYGADLSCYDNDGGDCAGAARLASPTHGEEVIRESSIEVSAYLDPTTNLLTLEIDGKYDYEPLSYQLYDVLGNLLDADKLTGIRTNIDMEDLPEAVYLLKVSTTEKEVVKTFKIVKN